MLSYFNEEENNNKEISQDVEQNLAQSNTNLLVH